MSTRKEVDAIKLALSRLEQYIHREEYKGYDPFDILTSPVFSLPVLKGNRLIRFGAQQIYKRLPFNLRPMLNIKKGYNPVTLGLCLQAYAYLCVANKEYEEIHRQRILFCLDELTRLQSKGYSGACWGYDFDWEARYSKISAYTPTVVATGIITNSLFEHYRLTGNQRSLALCESAKEFVLNDLNKTYTGKTFCYSYSPLDRQRVFNATMKGARLLTQVYSVTGDTRLLDEATKTVEFVIHHQQDNGAWSYSEGDARKWSDNFHTGYVLDCLDEYIKLSNDNRFNESLQRGISFYVNNFFVGHQIPKYYHNSLYPIDSTAAGQSILTLARFGHLEEASKVAAWMIKNMQDEKGYFYFRKNRYYTDRTSYMRWSNAWMFVAFANLLLRQNVLV